MSGLEALGIAASIIQVADIGFQLSKNIYNYAETAASTDDRLTRIGKNVDLTTEVVRRVAEVFEAEGGKKEGKGRVVVSGEALRLGRDVAGECEVVFGRLMGEVVKLRENPRRYYKFPFKENRLAVWEAQLEKLKTTLNCLMNVLILAQALKEKNDPSQWEHIERLIRERDEAAAKYEGLKKALEESEGSSPAITHAQTTVPPPRYDQIDGSRSPGDDEKPAPAPVRHLDECTPKVQAMLDTISNVQQSLKGQSRDYVKGPEITNLWSVYWSMNDKMTDTLRKLQSEYSEPKDEVQYLDVVADIDNDKRDTYTETITYSKPTPRSKTITDSTLHRPSFEENRTVATDEWAAFYPVPRRSPGVPVPTSPFPGDPYSQPLKSRFQSRPPTGYSGEQEMADAGLEGMVPIGVMSPKRSGADNTAQPEEKKKDVVDELLREWTTVYD
ncbi:hypothetical protein FQN54_005915 [Arachnomyces sp. PD_36]|nr:hypothetical protein FQN54_005915 [Arachnomyces sp. PD_36]